MLVERETTFMLQFRTHKQIRATLDSQHEDCFAVGKRTLTNRPSGLDLEWSELQTHPSKFKSGWGSINGLFPWQHRFGACQSTCWWWALKRVATPAMRDTRDDGCSNVQRC